MCVNVCVCTNSFTYSTIRRLSSERIYVTVVGIGLDFNTDVTKELGTIRACNYLGVKSAKEFKKVCLWSIS